MKTERAREERGSERTRQVPTVSEPNQKPKLRKGKGKEVPSSAREMAGMHCAASPIDCHELCFVHAIGVHTYTAALRVAHNGPPPVTARYVQEIIINSISY
jgi:hypothetical protein